MRKTILFLMVTVLSFKSLSSGRPDSTWQKWNWLMGEWVGEGSGKSGQESGWFSLQSDLDRKILVRKNHSEHPASKDMPGNIHDDLMIVFLDNTGYPGKAIYFDNEGHVINYTISFADTSIIFASDRIQNMPVFRLTYYLIDKENIMVKFEMSQDGSFFQLYREGKCRRKK
jgi:hypothetical protein